MPIVFVHAGYSPYLEFTLRQARHASPEAEIVLLGDADNDRFPFVTHVDAVSGVYADAAREVGSVYEHRSTNGEAFERVCFERWFRLRAWMEASGADRAMVLDSDVMLYAPEAEMWARYGAAPLALSLPAHQDDYRWVAGPHAMLWTAEALADFCAFTVESFRRPEPFEEKWSFHKRTGTPGGVCDMTALYLFAREREAANVAAIVDGAAFDHNINDAENEVRGEYATDGGRKALRWDADERPWGRSLRRGHDVRFLGLHLQGSAKGMIPETYTGPAFPRQRRIASSMAKYYAARSLAGRAKAGLWRLKGKLRP